VLPDACIDIVFDVSDKPAFFDALVMTPHLAAEKINLGRTFHFVGIRFFPGMINSNLIVPVNIIGKQINLSDIGGVNTINLRRKLTNPSNSLRKRYLAEFVELLYSNHLINENRMMYKIFSDIENITTVNDLAQCSNYSVRQLQRLILHWTGFKPRDLIKVIRFQQTLSKRGNFRQVFGYTDQSHYIKDFKKITGFSPKKFHSTY
jgi:AraC-like DNA-binding protein